MGFKIEEIRRIYDNSPVAFCVMQAITGQTANIEDFVFHYANAALAALVGRSVDELTGHTFYSIFKEHNEKRLRICGDVAQNGGSNTYTGYSAEIKKYICSQFYQLEALYCGCLLIDVPVPQETQEQIEQYTQDISALHNQLALYRSSHIGGVYSVRILVQHAENGQVAVSLFGASANNYFDAILMDIRMPQMDGLTAARAIRAMDRPDAKSVPILAMTANAFDEDVEKSKAAGMNAHLAKPIEPQQLYQTLSDFICERAQRG
ncbi:response regulator [Oscillibacter sp.]|uniref:response regulator n=1 Tax=Oscillibacter sp. TaxID=1945593 RepID=UPI00345B7721